jgi:hypothetical protein
MLFQTLDDRNECVATYCDNKLSFKELPNNLSRTWAYSQYLKGKDIEYAYIYCNGKTLDEVCPEHIKKDWTNIKSKLRAFQRSFKTAKVSLYDNCFFELVPQRFLIEFCKVKNAITEHVFETYKRPEQYEFYRDMLELVTDIRYRKLKVNLEWVKKNIDGEDSIKLYQKYHDLDPHVKFNIFGTVTGRLGTDKGFPILNFPSRHRGILEPNNDLFVEIDFNGAELRTALALTDRKQPQEDIYEMINREVFNNSLTRSETKDKAIMWLYDENAHNDKLEIMFGKNEMYTRYFSNNSITTPYGRTLEVEKRKSINWMMQSTFIDMFHRQVLKVNKILEDKSSYIPFMIHDCLYLDLKATEKNLLRQIIDTFSDTPYGRFKVKVKAGKNLNEMKELKKYG